MDRELWTSILDAVKHAAAQVGWHGGRRRPVYANWLIVAMYIWSVWHDRPLSWACRRGSYGGLFRPRKLPSISQFTRRIKSNDCQQILQLVHDQFAQRGLMIDIAYIDGKPLLVSPVSKDRDATSGKISGGFGRGYKLHALVNENRRIVVWSVMALNEDEKTVAREVLLPEAPPLSPKALMLADSNYDSAPLHQGGGRAAGHLSAASAAESTSCHGSVPRAEAAADAGFASRAGARVEGPAGAVALRVQVPPGDRACVRRADVHRRRPGGIAGVGARTGACASLGGREDHPVQRTS